MKHCKNCSLQYWCKIVLWMGTRPPETIYSFIQKHPDVDCFHYKRKVWKFWVKDNKKTHKEYTMLLGRYQCLPPHLGHQSLVRQLLKEGKNVLIALRKEDGTAKNPYTIKQRKKQFEKIFKKEIKKGTVKIIGIKDVVEVAYGRIPGWGIREIKLTPEIEAISGTKLRKEQNE